MTVLETETSTVMSENLWLEKTCSSLIPALPLWIIEYAWSKRMMGVLEVLGSPLWLEGEWRLLTLDEPCRIRVVAAEVLRILQTRDIQHFDRVRELIDSLHSLLPQLVIPIKHMKIMFGLETMFIMWMLWKDQSAAEISEKIESWFPSNLSQYYTCGRRHMELMKKNRDDFKSFAHFLARNREARETYMRDLMEEQYGERYAQKLEERLSHYLAELDKVLTQPTCIEEVLEQRSVLGHGEKILRKLLSTDQSSVTSVLKRLLHCGEEHASSATACVTDPSLHLSAVTSSLLLDESPSPPNPLPNSSAKGLHVVLRPSQNSTKDHRPSPSSSQSSLGLWNSLEMHTTPSQEPTQDGERISSSQTDCSPSLLQEKDPTWRCESPTVEQMCSRHGKKMKSILVECSEERNEEATQASCTPSCSPPPFAQSEAPTQTSPSLTSLHQDSSSTNISTSPQHPSSSKSHFAPSPSIQQITSSLSQSSLSNQASPKTKSASVRSTEPIADALDLVFCEHRADRSILKLSLESQSFLLKSKWLQPQLQLHRLREEEYGSRHSDEEQDHGHDYKFFDVNSLYSDSDSDSDSSEPDDPDYDPKEM